MEDQHARYLDPRHQQTGFHDSAHQAYTSFQKKTVTINGRTPRAIHFLMNTIRFFLADDHILIRAGVRSLLENIEGMEVVTEASDGREALELVKQHAPNIVLTDISMPGLNGLEAIIPHQKI